MCLRYHITSAVGSAQTDGCTNTHDSPNTVCDLSPSREGADCVSELSWQMKVTSET